MRALFLTGLALVSLGTVARADVKLVQSTSMDGELGQRVKKAGAPQAPSTTTYYKGSKMRLEAGETISIFDGQRLLVLDAKKKTYQVVPRDAASAANPMMAMMDVKAEMSVKPTGKTQAIQGKKAQLYVMTMTMNLGLKPGALKGEGAPKGEQPKIPPVTSKTEFWMVEFPGVSVGGSVRQNMMGNMGSLPFVKDMTEKLKALKGIPLLTVMNQEVMGRKFSVTVKTTALSEAPLPDSLFVPPPGFKQVPYEPPMTMMQRSGMPGR